PLRSRSSSLSRIPAISGSSASSWAKSGPQNGTLLMDAPVTTDSVTSVRVRCPRPRLRRGLLLPALQSEGGDEILVQFDPDPMAGVDLDRVHPTGPAGQHVGHGRR